LREDRKVCEEKFVLRPLRVHRATFCFENPRNPRNLRTKFMSNVPSDLKYTKSHEWVHVNGDTATVGITDHAQQELTDIVFVELPEIGKKFKGGDACAVVESVKTASDIYAPVSGEILESNQAVVDNPALANTEPYASGWFFKIKLSNPAELNSLLTPERYQAQISG
jgi:glycine cleavage system H protein